MREIDAILDRWIAAGEHARDAVLATVVHVTGSTYRRPGARMLVLADGERVGSISGGCLEGEVVRKARWLTAAGRPIVRAYDTTADTDGPWEHNLGCNGVVHVLLERTSSEEAADMLDAIQTARQRHQGLAVATVIRVAPHASVSVGDRLLVEDGVIRGGTLAGSSLEDEVRSEAVAVTMTRTSRLARLDRGDVFVEWVGPPLSLVIIGAGDDVVPLVDIAAHLGWRITVSDPRPSSATAGRFVGADRVSVLRLDDPLRGLDVDGHTAVVMMTHNYALDRRLLPHLLASRPRYLGLLGPRSRAEQLFAELGLRIPPFVHAPIGLDIGGDHPAATALSIAAEVHAVVHGREGRMLRLRDGSIHKPVDEVGTSAATGWDVTRPTWCEITRDSRL